jgi:glycosyltransferase involved in cell wall biosynthesis
MKRRVLLLRAADSSDWFSMNPIRRQWENAYREAFPGECAIVEAAPGRPVSAKALATAGLVVLLDHRLDGAAVLDALSASGARPRVCVHLFSDFLTRPAQREAARELGARFGAVFVAASRWLRDAALRELPGADVRVVPFPVADVFFKRPIARGAKRPLRWAYAGRVHPDKGINLLLEHLLRRGTGAPNLSLLGWEDGNPFLSWWERPADFARRRAELRCLLDILRLSPRRAATESALAGAFADVDAFVFPSIFKGEEFGYALAQALAAGKPCWASDWQGHRDFSSCPGVRMIPVVHEPGTVPTLDFGAAPLEDAPASSARGRAIREWARGHHSVAAVAAKLREAARP